MSNYVTYVDAQDELLIAQYPQADLNEQGQVALADFQAWYGLDDFEELDEEYAAVKKLINLSGDETSEVKSACPEGAKDLTALTAADQ